MLTTLSRFLLFIALLVSLSATSARADLSTKQARKIIATIGGMKLPTSAVHVTKVVMTAAGSAETSAELELVFRLSQSSEGSWRIREVRTGQGSWDDVEGIVKAVRLELPENDCNAPSQTARPEKVTDLSTKRARCLVANLFGVNLPSDSVRIKEISSLGLPLGSEPSTLAIALVRIDFRLSKDSEVWRVTEFKSGNRDWRRIGEVPTAVQEMKRSKAQSELRTVAAALEAFRRDRGFFVISDKQSVLIDHLSPRYLGTVTRLDPWNRPYLYQGERDRFTLRSAGPDSKPNTSDDIVVSSSTPE